MITYRYHYLCSECSDCLVQQEADYGGSCYFRKGDGCVADL
jgi:hypothetical protein